MPYFIIVKESNKFKLFGSLPVMIAEFKLSKSELEYHFSRKKLSFFENNQYKIYKVNLNRGGKQ